MSPRTVMVKWSKTVYEVRVEDDGALELKQALEKATGVPVSRQKLLARGAWAGVLRDDMSLSQLKPSQQVTLIGSAEVVVKPDVSSKFLEDMNEEEQAKSGLLLPAGLENLGNTCYMNSTLQCLRAVPDLRARLAAFNGSGVLASPLAATYNELDASTKAVAPLDFVLALRTAFPQFAQRGRRGGYAQQDAEELYSQLLSSLAASMGDVAVDSVFGVGIEETLSCTETGETSVRSDLARKLVCNIQGGVGQSKKIDILAEGLDLAMRGSVEKHSEQLGRDAVWSKTQTLTKLPPFLCVQFLRFFWKATPGNDDHAGVKCKILRPVTYPEVFDVYGHCSTVLQKHLKFNRNKADAEDVEMTDVLDDDLKQAIAMSLDADASPPEFAKQGLPANFTGDYELFALVTHKGRSADGGHYVAFVRQDGDDWLVFDDELVSKATTEFVVNNLKGGGDDHIAYLTFYRAVPPSDKHTKPKASA